MNKQQYQEARKELKQLEAIDWEEEDVDWEYVDHRTKCLKADIFAHDHATETAYNPYEQSIG